MNLDVCGVGRRRSVVGRLSPFINQWRPVVAGTGCAAPPPRRSAGRTQRRRQKPAAAPSSTRNPPEDYPDRQFFFTFRRFPPRLPLFLAGGHGTAVISLRPSPRFSSPPAPSRSRLLPNSSPLGVNVAGARATTGCRTSGGRQRRRSEVREFPQLPEIRRAVGRAAVVTSPGAMGRAPTSSNLLPDGVLCAAKRRGHNAHLSGTVT